MKIYGLIGQSLSHSFSQKYFSDKFIAEQIEGCEYQNFELQDLDKEIPVLKNLSNLFGLNVTIPYKTRIISFLDDATEECREMNACNCVQIKKGKWIGYNTDVIGFEKSFTPHLKPHHKKALILGTGGASKAVAFVLKKRGIDFLKVSRRKSESPSVISYDEISADLMSEYKIVINTSPLGTFPNVNEFPPLPYASVTNQHYFFDLVYNPPKTLFLSFAEKQGATIENGSQMLSIQAEESWKTWNA